MLAQFHSGRIEKKSCIYITGKSVNFETYHYCQTLFHADLKKKTGFIKIKNTIKLSYIQQMQPFLGGCFIDEFTNNFMELLTSLALQLKLDNLSGQNRTLGHWRMRS